MEKVNYAHASFIPAVFFILLFIHVTVKAQMTHYWSYGFSDESTMLSGAVVGGGEGASAFFYNPAGISQSSNSQVSFNAGLAYMDIFHLKDPFGPGSKSSRLILDTRPRLISFLVNPKKKPALTLQLVLLSRDKLNTEFDYSNRQTLDILTHSPGLESYFGKYQFRLNYSDYLVGIGSAYRLSEKLSFGISLYGSIFSLDQIKVDELRAIPLESSPDASGPVASYTENRFFRFNVYNLYAHLGLAYHSGSISLGISVKSPSLKIYSDGKRSYVLVQQNNITDPDSGDPLPDYTITDSKTKKEIDARMKQPLSISAGIRYKAPGARSAYYTAMEFFFGIPPYLMIEAEPDPNMISGEVSLPLGGKEYLSTAWGAKPVINLAAGYSLATSKSSEILLGFRTDFSYLKNFNYGEMSSYDQILRISNDTYHFTGGAKFTILGHFLMVGWQYSIAHSKNEKLVVNMTEPVEYNTTLQKPLQGDQEPIMSITYNGLSFFFGATLNIKNK